MNKHHRLYCPYFFYGAILFLIISQIAFYKVVILTGDHPAHINFSRIIFSNECSSWLYPNMFAYPLFHISVKIVSLICFNDFDTAATCILIISNVLSIYLIRTIIYNINITDNIAFKYLNDVISVAYIFFETIASPLTNGRIYAEQCAPNPWHNPTISFVRPFGLLVIIFFIKLFCNYDKQYKNYILFSIFSAISLFVKPNFMLVFLPAFVIYIFLWWRKLPKERFSHFYRMLFSLIPSCVILLFQFFFFQFYNNGTVSPIHIKLGGFSGFSIFSIISVCIATFPVPILGILVIRRNISKSVYLSLAYLALGIGVIEMFMLSNGSSGDFSWGYDIAVGFSTLTTLAYLLCKQTNLKVILAALICFSLQLYFGIYYYIQIYNLGGSYWF